MIPYGCQSINEEDEIAVLETLRSEFLTQGPAIAIFEQAIAGQCDVPQAIAVSNGTAALHLACLALDVGPGDWVWTTPNTFVASANCARYCGANIDFVDIAAETLNLCAARLEEKLNQAQQNNRLPKVVIPVHFGGRSCDMQAISSLSHKFGFRIIEDASHALGATYQNSAVGNCQYADITTTSFHPVKIITTAEGGMLTTRNHALSEKLRLFRSHGITREQRLMSDADKLMSEGPWYYEQIALGFNYRMTDIQATLGSSQMTRLAAFVARRRALARRYEQGLSQLNIGLPMASDESAWHLYPIRVASDQRRSVFDSLRAAGIGVNVHYFPVHLQPYYRKLGFVPGQFPEAERYYSEAITLPLHQGLTDDQQDQVMSALELALK